MSHAPKRFVLAAALWLAHCGFVRGQEWQPLFDGLTTNGWMQEDGRAVDAPAWEVTQGMLHLDRSLGRGGNLLTQDRFGDFELIYEWKLAPGANNGLKYRVNQFDGRYLGIEYQMIDDPDGKLKPRYRTASLYDLYEPRSLEMLRPVGEFNRSRIVVQAGHVEHWLNGHLVNEANFGDAAWAQRLAKSKFADVEGFGVTPTGHIMLTDHGDEVWYRNLFLRRLDAVSCAETMPHGVPTCREPVASTITQKWRKLRSRRCQN